MDKIFCISIVEIWCMSFRKKREEIVLLMIFSIEINIFLFSSSSLRVSWEIFFFQPSRCDLCKGASTLMKLRSFWSDRSLVWISIKVGCLCGFKRSSEDIHDHQLTVKIESCQGMKSIYFFLFDFYIWILSHICRSCLWF